MWAQSVFFFQLIEIKSHIPTSTEVLFRTDHNWYWTGGAAGARPDRLPVAGKSPQLTALAVQFMVCAGVDAAGEGAELGRPGPELRAGLPGRRAQRGKKCDNWIFQNSDKDFLSAFVWPYIQYPVKGIALLTRSTAGRSWTARVRRRRRPPPRRRRRRRRTEYRGEIFLQNQAFSPSLAGVLSTNKLIQIKMFQLIWSDKLDIFNSLVVKTLERHSLPARFSVYQQRICTTGDCDCSPGRHTTLW